MNLKFEKINIKMIVTITLLNLIYLGYYLLLILYPKSDMFGSISEFFTSLIYFPLLVLILSFSYKTIKQKILFNILSFFTIYCILVLELITTSFDVFGLKIFFVYLIIPVVSAFISYLLERLLNYLKTC